MQSEHLIVLMLVVSFVAMLVVMWGVRGPSEYTLAQWQMLTGVWAIARRPWAQRYCFLDIIRIGKEGYTIGRNLDEGYMSIPYNLQDYPYLIPLVTGKHPAIREDIWNDYSIADAAGESEEEE